MRLLLILLCVLGLAGLPAVAAEPVTALQALKLLPKEAWARLARVNAFEGEPGPERWHILVHDTREETGLHEYVIANGEVVASRGVSQFADELKADDIIGGDAVKIDSDRAANIAQQYAQANKLEMKSCNYELKKDGEGAAPLWHITCVDAKGEEIGQLLVTATKGSVIRHDGFAIEPALTETPVKKLATNSPEYQKQLREWNAYQQKQASRRAARDRALAEQQQRQLEQPDGNRPGIFRRIFGGR